MRNPRRVLSKAQILDRVWNYDFGGQANVVELYISYLRKKIDAGREPMIHTMRGAGYVLKPVAVNRLRDSLTSAAGRSPRSALVALVSLLIGAGHRRSRCATYLDRPARRRRARPRAAAQRRTRRPAAATTAGDRAAGDDRGSGRPAARPGRRHAQRRRRDDGDRAASLTAGPAARPRSPRPASVIDALGDVPADGDVHDVDLARRSATTGSRAEHRRRHRRSPACPTERRRRDASSRWCWREALLVLLGVARGRGAPALSSYAASCARCARSPPPPTRSPSCRSSAGEIDLVRRGCPTTSPTSAPRSARSGAALNTLLAHVETSLEARHRSEQQVRQFVADASHELRTPLATIAGLHRARPAPPRRGQRATALAKVEAESARMTALVEDLLLLARLDAGRPLDRRAGRPDPAAARGGRRRPGARARPPLAARAARRAGRGAPATSSGCTRWSPTCSPTPASTPRPAPRSP